MCVYQGKAFILHLLHYSRLLFWILVEIKKSTLSKLFADMDIHNDPNDEHLASYDIQLCIQESIEASQAVFHPER